MKLRIPRTVLSHLAGSSPWDDPKHADPADVVWADKMKAAKPRKDGSVTIDVTDPDELFGLRSYIDTELDCAADNISFDGPGEYVACRNLLAKIDASGIL